MFRGSPLYTVSDMSIMPKIMHHVALGLIVYLQLSRYVLRLLNRWNTERKANPILMALVTLSDLESISITS